MTGATETMTDSLAVHQDRIARLQAEMGRQRVEVTLIGPSSDFFYLTGHDAHLSERMTLLIVPQSGPASVVVPVLEAPLVLARRELFDISAWTETESPAERAASATSYASRLSPPASHTSARTRRPRSASPPRYAAAP